MLAISARAASRTGLAPSRTSVRPGYTRGCAAFAHRRVDGKRTTGDDDVVMAPTTRVDVAAPLALLALASVVPPSHASESFAAFAAFSSDGDAVERARDVLDRLETLPQIETIPLWLFVMTLSEMLPLFPSQPAALTSGIVFGAKEGAAMVVAANWILRCPGDTRGPQAGSTRAPHGFSASGAKAASLDRSCMASP